MSTCTTERQAIPNGELIGQYEIIDLIGVGSFGGVYQVRNQNSNIIYAMKTEKIHSKKRLLQTEIEILKKIGGSPFFPEYVDSGFDLKYQVNFLIMSYFGASIDEIQDYHQYNLYLGDAYNIALKMLEPIKTLHQFGFVHRDIKPNNFLLKNDTKYPVALVDFNLSSKFINPKTNQPFQCVKEKNFVGTKIFASIDVLSSLSCGFKDDLIAWFYSFLYLVCGSLPWALERDKNEVISMKKDFKLDDLDYEFPQQFQKIYDYLKTLKYDDFPDYDLIEKLFISGMKDDSFSPDDYDWSEFISNHSNMIQFEEEISKLTLNAINERNKNDNYQTN